MTQLPDCVAFAVQDLHCMECGHQMERKRKWSDMAGALDFFVRCINRECFYHNKVFHAPNQVPLYASHEQWEDL